jgi:hypothetical protein
MKSSDAGWFGAGALVGGVIAAIFKERILSGKILIVSDGSVDAKATFSKIRKKGADKPKKHQWTAKPEVVHIAYGRAGASETCDGPVASVEFSNIESVEFRVTRGDDLQSVLTTIVARKGDDSRLYLEMADDWELKGDDGSRKLHRSNESEPAEARLESVTIRFVKGPISIGTQTYSATESEHLCAVFEDRLFGRS